MSVAKRIKSQKNFFITSFDVNEICCYFHENDVIRINSNVQNEIDFCSFLKITKIVTTYINKLISNKIFKFRSFEKFDVKSQHVDQLNEFKMFYFTKKQIQIQNHIDQLIEKNRIDVIRIEIFF